MFDEELSYAIETTCVTPLTCVAHGLPLVLYIYQYYRRVSNKGELLSYFEMATVPYNAIIP